MLKVLGQVLEQVLGQVPGQVSDADPFPVPKHQHPAQLLHSPTQLVASASCYGAGADGQKAASTLFAFMLITLMVQAGRIVRLLYLQT